jgi:(5-formylfuran-3-yl)methyl phosphate synthase
MVRDKFLKANNICALASYKGAGLELLISVRSADEVAPAIEGGADIIDAKDPEHGGLGAVSRVELARILALVPSHSPISVALGDVTTVDNVRTALDGLEFCGRAGVIYLKLGFAGVHSLARIRSMIAVAGRMASSISRLARVVAVAYADADRAGTIAPAALPQLARGSGAAGVLLDTYLKDGRGLVDCLDTAELRGWVYTVRRAGLLAALAGALKPSDLGRLRELDPDVVGVRGAACEGGRGGRVSAARVLQLRETLDRPRQISLRQSSSTLAKRGSGDRNFPAQPS